MTSLLNRAFVWLLGALLLAAGLVFTASLVVAALLLGAVSVVTSLLRGQRPTFRVHLRRGFGDDPWSALRRRRGAPAEVVDVEAREVPAAPPRLEGEDVQPARRRD